MKQLTYLILAASIAIGVSACNFQDNRGSLQLVIQYSVLKYVGADEEKANRVIAVTQFVREQLNNSPSVRIASLVNIVRERVDWTQLDAADALLADALLTTIQDELVARYGDGILDQDHLVAVDEVIAWVQRSASLVVTKN